MIDETARTAADPRTSGRGLLGWLALGFLLAPAGLAQTEITFRLVPEERWEGSTRSDALPTGRVFLYRAGSYRPELVAPANAPRVITPGSWLWISEAEDAEGGLYVSVVSGKIHYPEGAERYDKGLIGPVVPACRVELGPAEHWQGVERLDAVSLDRHAVYPVIAEDRRRFHVPAGRFLAYTVGADGISAISRVIGCRAGETLRLARPQPPAADHQDLMVSVQIPDAAAGDSEKVSAVLATRDASRPLPPQLPSAALRTSSRTTFFFLDAYARERLDLEIRHPEALPHRQELSPLPGGVRELPDVVLEAKN